MPTIVRTGLTLFNPLMAIAVLALFLLIAHASPPERLDLPGSRTPAPEPRLQRR
jgi:hypothetical protein